MRDLLLLCPDIKWQVVLTELLARPDSLHISRCDYEVRRLMYDPQARVGGVPMARVLRDQFQHAMLIFDHDGCGDRRAPEALEEGLRRDLAVDWGDAAEPFVVAPEIEIWLMGATQAFRNLSPATKDVDARRWMEDRGWWDRSQPKPVNPKGAFEAFCYHFNIRPTAPNYRRLARDASLRLDRCQCDSFHRFVQTLRRWFPPA